MYELALFAGAGGGLLASKWRLGWQTVCYVENNPYCVEVLKARIRDGWLDDAPIWSNIRSFTKHNNQCRPFIRSLGKMADRLVISAGFPCQPFSKAGKVDAAANERNGWPDTIRLINEIRPRAVFLENVTNLLAGSHGYFGTILKELAESGYDAKWRVLSAAELGAPHRRDRLWLVAHPHRRPLGQQYHAEAGGTEGQISANELANADGPKQQLYQPGQQGEIPLRPNVVGGGSPPGSRKDALGFTQRPRLPSPQPEREYEGPASQPGWWSTEPPLGRMADGLAHRVGQLRALGNGQVPVVAATAWKMLDDDDWR